VIANTNDVLGTETGVASSSLGGGGGCCYCGVTLPSGERSTCMRCHASASDRYLWMTISKSKLLFPMSRVLHYKPSPPVARRFFAYLGSNYHACAPASFASADQLVPFHLFNPVEDAQHLAPNAYSLIIVTADLRQVKSDLIGTLRSLAKAVSPGGSLLFGGIADVKEGSKEGSMVEQSVRAEFRRRCRTRSTWKFTRDELKLAGVSPSQFDRLSSDTLWWYQK